MTSHTESQWIVLKFGGTSVSSVKLAQHRRVATARRAQGPHVLIVHSAVSGITDRLERLLAAATGEHEAASRTIEDRHLDLRRSGHRPRPATRQLFRRVAPIAEDIHQHQQLSDRTARTRNGHGRTDGHRNRRAFLQQQGLRAVVGCAHGLKAVERARRIGSRQLAVGDL